MSISLAIKPALLFLLLDSRRRRLIEWPPKKGDELETASAGITAVNSATTVLVKRLRMVVRGSWAVNRYTTGKSINGCMGNIDLVIGTAHLPVCRRRVRKRVSGYSLRRSKIAHYPYQSFKCLIHCFWCVNGKGKERSNQAMLESCERKRYMFSVWTVVRVEPSFKTQAP